MKIGKMRLVPILVFVLLIFFLWRGLSTDKKLPSVQIGQPVPAFSLPRLDSDGIFSAQDMLGHVAILNIWASWCASCKAEQEFLMQQSKAGVYIYGLNYKDNKENALDWLKQWGNPYLMIGYDEPGSVAIDLGVYGAPETFIIDKKGIIQYRHIGLIDADIWKKEFKPLIQKLESMK